MKKLLFIFLITCKLVNSQTHDTVALRSIYIGDFCLGDSVSHLFNTFGFPTETKLKVVDDALENCEPSKNLYFYGKNYFSEPYLLAEKLIGEFNINTLMPNFKLKLLIEEHECVFELGDSLRVEELLELFPNSMKFSTERFKRKASTYFAVYIKVSGQKELFPYPYPLIQGLSLYYRNSLLYSYRTYYYIE